MLKVFLRLFENGVKICNNEPIMSHLLFADDCFFFFLANVDQASKMRDILSTCERASAQAVNLQKSKIFCNRNILTTYHNNIANILGMQAILGTSKYLGPPSTIGRIKKSTFSFIEDRIWKKTNLWSSKSLMQNWSFHYHLAKKFI